MILVMLLLVLTIVRALAAISTLSFRGNGGGRFVKRMTQIAASAGGYIRIARQCRFLVIMRKRCFIQQDEQITVDQSKVLKIDRIDCSVFEGIPGIKLQSYRGKYRSATILQPLKTSGIDQFPTLPFSINRGHGSAPLCPHSYASEQHATEDLKRRACMRIM